MSDLGGPQDLEQRLADRAGPGLPSELRAKVLAEVRAACAKPRSSRIEQIGRIGFGRFVAATAAAVVLWLNLAMSAAEYSPWPAAAMGPAQGQATSEDLRALLPELDEPTARVWAWRMRTGCRLVPAPRVPPQGAEHASGVLDNLRTEAPWDTH
ncbi:MAG: hypothetical protein HY291_06125 [Planctomycetes bacterium]|nr:hypothetical protein [Planctomycetota bacterium]